MKNSCKEAICFLMHSVHGGLFWAGMKNCFYSFYKIWLIHSSCLKPHLNLEECNDRLVMSARRTGEINIGTYVKTLDLEFLLPVSENVARFCLFYDHHNLLIQKDIPIFSGGKKERSDVNSYFNFFILFLDNGKSKLFK